MPEDAAQLKVAELRERADSGIVNPGKKTRKKNMLFYRITFHVPKFSIGRWKID